MRLYINLSPVLVFFLSLNWVFVNTAPGKADKFNSFQIPPCSQIEKIVNNGVTLEVYAKVKTGGVYQSGCNIDLDVNFIPPPGKEFLLEDYAGEACISNSGIHLGFGRDGIQNDSRLDCLQLDDPLILSLNFTPPVYSRELERYHVQHRGDPHPETIPFSSATFQADSFRTDIEPNTREFRGAPFDPSNGPPRLETSIEEPPCMEFGYPGRPAHIPGIFDTLDGRTVAQIFPRSTSFADIPIAVFLHNYDQVEDIFSTGEDGLVDHEAQFSMEWKKSTPFSPYVMLSISDMLSFMTELQISAQTEGGGYEYPNDWFESEVVNITNREDFETYLEGFSFSDVGSGTSKCRIPLDAIGQTFAVFDAIRDLVGFENLADIPTLHIELGISHAELINFENLLKQTVKRLSVHVDTSRVSFPRLLTLLDRFDLSLLGDNSTSTFETPLAATCGGEKRNSPVSCLKPPDWKNIFGINPALNLSRNVAELVHGVASTWEPVICSAFPDSSNENCLAVQQWSCGGNRKDLRRKVLTNQQTHNPTCKLWKPAKKLVDESIISGSVTTNKGFSFGFSQMRIHNRRVEHKTTDKRISNFTAFEGFFDLRKLGGSSFSSFDGYRSSISAKVQTDYGSLSPNHQLLDASDRFLVLQCGEIYSHSDFVNHEVTENPYKRYCDNRTFYPDTELSRGCTPLDLPSQKNFLFVPRSWIEEGGLGTDCGEMNFNTGELGGSFLRLLEQRFGKENLLKAIRDPDSGLTPSMLFQYATSEYLCASGQTCPNSSPCRMYKEMKDWGGHIHGDREIIYQEHLEELDQVNGLPAFQCYFGDHPALPEIVEEIPVNQIELTRSNYRPYQFLQEQGIRGKYISNNPNLDLERILSGELPPSALRSHIHSITSSKGFCTGQGGGYPSVLDIIMSQDIDSLYYPVVWIATPDEFFTDGPLHLGGSPTNLRNRNHGRPLSLYTDLQPDPDTNIPPSPIPSPTPFPSPTPSPVPTPSPSPQSYQFTQKIHNPHMFMQHTWDTVSTFSGEDSSFNLKLSMPLPRTSRRIQIEESGAACIFSTPPTQVFNDFPKTPDVTLLPLLGNVQNDISGEPGILPDKATSLELYLTILCLPVRASDICYDIDPSNSFINNSCTNLETFELEQTYAPPALLRSVISATKIELGLTGGLKPITMDGPLQHGEANLLNGARLIRMKWNQTQFPMDAYEWKVAFLSQVSSRNGTIQKSFDYSTLQTPLFQIFLSVSHPNIIASRVQTFTGGGHLAIVRFLQEGLDRIPSSPETCLYDTFFCTSGLPPSPSPSPTPTPTPTPTPVPTPGPVKFIPPLPVPTPTPVPATNMSSSSGLEDCGFFAIQCHKRRGTLFDCPGLYIIIFLAVVIFFIIPITYYHYAQSSHLTQQEEDIRERSQ